MTELEMLTDNSREIVADIHDLKALRVTGLVSFAECPKRWAADQLGLVAKTDREGTADQATSKYARWGTAVHHAIEGFLKRRWGHERTAGWEEVETLLKEEGVPPDERAKCLDYCAMLRSQFGEPLMVEFKASGYPQPMYALPTPGTLDAVFWNADDHVWDIVDHKTNREYEGAETWKERIQPLFYSWLLRNFLRTNADFYSCWAAPIRYSIGYVNLGRFVTWTYTDEEFETVPSIYADLWSEFEVYRRTQEWPERLNRWCSSCPMVAVCAKAQEGLNNLAALAEAKEEAQVSALARADFLSNVAKLASDLLDRTRLEVKDAMKADGLAEWEEGNVRASLSFSSKRKADPSDVFDNIPDKLLPPDIDDWHDDHRELFNAIFSVRLGELDKYAVKNPELGIALVGVIRAEDAEEPTLTIRRAAKKAK